MRRFFLVLFISLFSVVSVSAEEGMWMLDQLPIEQLKSAGFQLTQDQIYSPDKPSISDAIVQIGGGTGSIVSENGLVITNHHVASSALQRLSAAENNYVKRGYQAADRNEELYVPGYKAYLAVEFTDVTEEITSGITEEMDPAERYSAIQDAIKVLEEERESGAPEIYHYDVSEFSDGLKYYLFKYLEFEDIRLVYAPPESIGSYGGEIDNWMWPRHSGDFAFFRIYASPDMQSGKHSEENVPYTPKRFLKMTDDGINWDDFTFIIGYPGGTQRYRTSYSVRYNINKSYPFQIAMYDSVLSIIERKTTDNDTLTITYADRKASLENYYKNFHGMLEGLKKADLLDRKLGLEKEFTSWMNQEPDRKEKYGHILPALREVYTSVDSIYPQQNLMNSMQWLARVYYAATLIDKWSLEKQKPNLERENQYMDRNVPRLRERLSLMQGEFDPAVDKEIMKYFLRELGKLPEHLQLAPVMEIAERYPDLTMHESIVRFVNQLYAKTQLNDQDRRMEIFGMSREEIEDLNDPMIEFAREMRPVIDRLDQYDKWLSGELTRLRPLWIRGLHDWRGGEMYPDANFTPRLTYGMVDGYSPRDAVLYEHITSGKGILEKHTGEEPFDAPDRLLELLREGGIPPQYVDSYLLALPVDFLHTTDITGGNSGSPVMDAQGRFIGIAFDGNWESISADWVFNPSLTRSISVDARYILFILEQFAENDYVLDELRVE